VYVRRVEWGWWILGGIVVAAVIGWLVYLRSLRRWRSTKPTTPEAKQAEARLWATKTMDQR
jgi:hypothetical protein